MLFQIINKVIKTSKKHIYFESAFYFFDNSFILFSHIKKKYPRYKLHYACYKKSQLNNYQNKNISKNEIVDYTNNHCRIINKFIEFKNIVIEKKCSLVFASYLIDNFKKYDNTRDGRKVVMLWHGTIAIKTIAEAFKFHFDKPNNYYFVSPTTYCRDLEIKEAPALKNCNYVIGGQPRNDLVNSTEEVADQLSKLCSFDVRKHNIYLICCTFRQMKNENNADFFADEFPINFDKKSLYDLNKYLISSDSFLLIKTHHTQNNINLGKWKSAFHNIVFLNQDDFDKYNLHVNQIFKYTKALLTDYSSIYFDYLLVNKPVGFMQNDIKRYKKIRGLASQEILNLLIGEKLETTVDLVNFLKKVNNSTISFDFDKAKSISKLVNGEYVCNCESICQIFNIK